MSDILNNFNDEEFEGLEGGGKFPTPWRPEATDPEKRSESTVLTGEYVRTDEHDFGYGPTKLMILNVDGEEFSRALTGSVLPDRVAKQNIRVGDTVRVVYDGKITGKSGREYNAWRVGVRRKSGDVPF